MEPQALSTLVQLGIAGNPISLHGSHICAKLWSSLPLTMSVEHNAPHYLSQRATLDKRRNEFLSVTQEEDTGVVGTVEFEALWQGLEQAPFFALDANVEVSCEWKDDTNVTGREGVLL